ncbi:MAG: hypothetical protein HKN34_10510, partial [Gammaproteobacteria bacterium]|nr:hypothetical protein [Gammaproteobacteria bacterium]
MQKVELQYLTEKCQGAIYYASSAGRNAQFTVDPGMKTYTVEVEDGRGRHLSPNTFDGQDASGFDLLAHTSKVKNFLDKNEIAGRYEDELKALIKSHTGAYRVEFFDHTVRASDPE